MPRIMEFTASDGSIYKIASSIGDVIERESPDKWFGKYAFFIATRQYGLSNDEAKERSVAVLKAWANKPCPAFLLALLDSYSKNQQERLLRNKSITPEDLVCWIIQSIRWNGLFSQYSYDSGVPNELDGRTPILIDATNPEMIKTLGKTDLSDAALFHLAWNQKIIIAQFVDLPDGRWYCFYRTLRGLAGRESGHHGQHMHFLSNSYGIGRDEIIEGIMKGRTPHVGFHIHLGGY